MNIAPANIIPITRARTKLGNLAQKVSGENYVILTKDGNPKAALVDINYLTKLEDEVRRLYGKTFIDPKLLRYTREFSEEEVKRWQKEDTL